MRASALYPLGENCRKLTVVMPNRTDEALKNIVSPYKSDLSLTRKTLDTSKFISNRNQHLIA